MRFLENLKFTLWRCRFQWTGWRNPVIEDRHLSTHFTLYDLTKTTHLELQDQNRILTDGQVLKLTHLALLLEEARKILDVPLVISSAYRCPELNKRVGSTPRSQHLLCEAADFYPKDMGRDVAFRKLIQAGRLGQISFGQLIWEKDQREGLKEWIHLSLGTPYREKARCGQALTMIDSKYNLIERVI
jgi:hypothetical protein